MVSLLGCYWSVMHRRPQDYSFFQQQQPAVFKIMDGGGNDYQWAHDNLQGSLIVARDWALSEQHADLLKDPQGTGRRHAQEWAGHQQRLGFDKARTLILGINEPRIWEPGVPEALRVYTIALCDEATHFGLRVGAMQLSVGWPANTGPDTPPNWSPWHGVDNAIRHNNGALVLHEYWADNGPGENWGWWGGRALKCPWQVPIVIGETGVDMMVKYPDRGANQRGWRENMPPDRYAAELADYTTRMSADSRFVGCAVFAADYASQDWWSFDIEPAYAAILSTPLPVRPEPEPEPEPPTGALVHPLPERPITQHFYQNPQNYAQWGLPGHNGTDFGAAQGTPIACIADGVVVYSAWDDNYGHYVRVQHDHFGVCSFYAHLSAAVVPVGKVLNAGDPVGLVGSTGKSTGPHLHLEIRTINTDGSYALGVMPKGRVDPESWFVLHAVQL
jgi:hypothetical protein